MVLAIKYENSPKAAGSGLGAPGQAGLMEPVHSKHLHRVDTGEPVDLRMADEYSLSDTLYIMFQA